MGVATGWGWGSPLWPAAGMPYTGKVLTYSPIGYWPLNEASGATAYDLSGNDFHGTTTSATPGATGIGDGGTSYLFDGLNDFVDIYSTGFRDAFAVTNDPTGLLDESEGSAMVWAKVFNVGVWTDTSEHRRALNLGADDNSAVSPFYKTKTNNQLISFYTAGGTKEQEITTAYGGIITWLCFAITWSKSAGANGQVIYYVNGAQQGATDTTLGVWEGSLAATATVIGDSGTGSSRPWHGWLAHAAVFPGVLTPAEVADLYVI